MGTGNAILLAVGIGVVLGILVWLVLTGRLRISLGFRPDDTDERTVSAEYHDLKLTRLTDDDARDLSSLPPGARQALEEAVRTGQASERIVVNVDGDERVYHSLDELPPELRARLEEARGEGGTHITLTVNGVTHTYRSRDEVPPEFRRFLPPEGL